MIVALLITGFIVLLLSVFIDPIGTSNALIISTVLFILAIVFTLFKSKKTTE
ncbi:hypothetical protein [Halobacillus campisalis]|uniref:Uncharacterized protein n=1 Tax=Halobacillus campisalis TaxID=435909 RepID=A0ABW2JZQ4_9BACI|nr:hypothetical protein [Halobacillus campisalis]